MAARDHLAVALDFPDRRTALAMVDALGDDVLWFKVGLELYLAEGAPLIAELGNRGKRIFLDLKLHDIPNTVAAAVRTVSKTGAELLTVHASGGPAMLQAALDAAHTSSGRLKIIAVTILTSMDEAQLEQIGVARSPSDAALALGSMALRYGADGLVCSPQEVTALRSLAGEGPLLVVPGIRNSDHDPDDQRRTASAAEAVRWGASLLVVGRPITRASDPHQAALRIIRQIARETI